MYIYIYIYILRRRNRGGRGGARPPQLSARRADISFRAPPPTFFRTSVAKKCKKQAKYHKKERNHIWERIEGRMHPQSWNVLTFCCKMCENMATVKQVGLRVSWNREWMHSPKWVLVNYVVRGILNKIHDVKFSAMLADETRDVQSKEQLATCICWVDDQLDIHEDLIWL